MPKIIKLPQQVINQIAAGEVVERPASVVKELIENALDAGADSITINIEKGGKKLISVQDNGEGMTEEDLALAIQPHTTSKITTLRDLEKISTLGFRGEALASIASVSKLNIKSKTEKGDGYEISVEGGEIKENFEIAMPVGTLVEVRDLFYNVPARKKFLKSDQTELRNIIDLVTDIAISHPYVTIKLNHNSRTLLHLPAETDLKDDFLSSARVQELVGTKESEDLINLFFEGNGMKVSGLVGHPKKAASRKRDQFIFVNRRPISDKVVARAVKEGFGSYIPQDKYPIFVVALEIDGQLVDVNVHPRKSEVKFRDPQIVFSAVKKSVREALKKALDLAEHAKPIHGDVDTYDEMNEIAVKRLRESDSDLQAARKGVTQSWKDSSKLDMGDKYRLKSTQKEIRDSLAFTQALLEGGEEVTDGKQDDMLLSKAIQMHGRYIVVEAPGEIQVWDQHAAAERIRYEKLLEEYKGKGIEKQNLLSVEMIKVSPAMIFVVEEYSADLAKLGFDLEVFGKNEISVRAIPAVLIKGDVEEIMKDLLSEVADLVEGETHKNLIGDHYDELIKILACHSSVTANVRLQDNAVGRFIQDLKKCENPYSCPHGRPIVWRIKTDEIDKKFDR